MEAPTARADKFRLHIKVLSTLRRPAWERCMGWRGVSEFRETKVTASLLGSHYSPNRHFLVPATCSMRHALEMQQVEPWCGPAMVGRPQQSRVAVAAEF